MITLTFSETLTLFGAGAFGGLAAFFWFASAVSARHGGQEDLWFGRAISLLLGGFAIGLLLMVLP